MTDTYETPDAIVTKLNAQPGEMLVLKFKKPMTADQIQRVQMQFREALKRIGRDDVGLLGLDDGITFQVVTLPEGSNG